MIYLTSDLHFWHDKEFVYKPRGFNSIEEMNEAIVKNWNAVVKPEDDVYVLGDLMLNDAHFQDGLDLIKSLNGTLHICIGNHDTAKRYKAYYELPNVKTLNYVEVFMYAKYHFYLSHYPTLTSNPEKEDLKKCMINLYGHTHQKTNFYNEMPFMYHVGMDSHSCTPVSIDQIIKECNAKVQECKSML